MRVSRPCYTITTKNPGSDLAGETAAALAATAKVWLATGSDKRKHLSILKDQFFIALPVLRRKV